MVPICQRLLGSLVFVLAQSSVCEIAAQQPSSITIDQIRNGLKSWESQLLGQPSLYFEYTQDRDYVTPPAPSLKIKFVNAKKGDFYYTSYADLVNGNLQSLKQYTWKDRVGCQRFVDAITILPDPHPNLWDQSHYSHAIFLDTFKGLSVSSKSLVALIRAVSFSDATPLALPKSINTQWTAWSVLPGTDNIDGDECVVISNGKTEKLWIDVPHGFVCRKRERVRADGSPLYKYENRQLKKFTKEIWLPEVQVVTLFRQGKKPTEEIFRRETNRLVKVAFSELPDEFFEIPIPDSNGYIIDEIRGIRYVVPDKGLSEEAAIARGLIRVKAGLDARRHKVPSSTAWATIVLANILSVAFFFWRRRLKNGIARGRT